MEKINKSVLFLADADSVFNIVDTIRESLIVLDESLQIKLVNRSFCKTFHVTPEETEKKRIYELGNGQWDSPHLRVLLEKVLPEHSNFDDFMVEHDFPGIGKKIMLLNARKLISEPAGNKPMILLAMEDITERKRFERERDHALKSREELVAVISHEIRNPLTTIITSLEIIKKTLPPQDGLKQPQKSLDHIRAAVQQMTRITSDLLDVTKIEAGHLPIEPSVIDIASLVEEMVILFRPLTAQKSILLETKISPEAKSVDCDRNRIIQVLSNLLTNAIKFTGEGGVVLIKVDRVRERIRFQIKDTGCGIPEDQIPHVFERFWQAKHKQYLGAGLGLYVAKSIIEGHGGRIGLKSKVGDGSTFYFTLSASDEIVEVLPKKSA